MVKPGPKTSEFQLSIATLIGNLIAALAGALPAQWAALVSAAVVAAYSVARGQAKSGGGAAP